jgi:EF hand
MVRMIAAVVVLLLFFMQSARAEGEGSPLEQAIARDAARFTAMAEDVIAGFGGPEGLTPSGIEEHVALTRASARAGAMRRLLAMDLDNDGSVGREELGVSLRAASASARGRLERQFTAADANGDGLIGAEEMRAQGQAAALRALTEDEVAVLRALMTFDADGNGALLVEELRAAMLRLEKAA